MEILTALMSGGIAVAILFATLIVLGGAALVVMIVAGRKTGGISEAEQRAHKARVQANKAWMEGRDSNG